METQTDNKSGVKKQLKDVTTLDGIDFDQIDLIKGDTPDDIKQKCLQLCKDYLSGVWTQQTLDSIEVQRISGGMTNQLYYCGISGSVDEKSSVPLEVVIRLYGHKYFNNHDCDGNERLTDVIIGLMVSESGLGPKVYGLFESGQIQAYYKHRQFKLEDQSKPKLVDNLFKKLARVHAMDVPIKKSHWFFTVCQQFYGLIQNNPDNSKLIDELKLDTLAKNDLKVEMQFIKDVINSSKSPMVFCHNDFRGANIMVLEDNNNNDSKDQDDIVLCDFEYSSYGYRGHDFGQLMNEWNRSIHKDFMKPYVFPEDSEVIPLIEIYRKESEHLIGKQFTDNPINSCEHILKEIKIFTLATILTGTLFILKNDSNAVDSIQFDKKLLMQICETGYKNYFALKNQLVAQNIF